MKRTNNLLKKLAIVLAIILLVGSFTGCRSSEDNVVSDIESHPDVNSSSQEEVSSQDNSFVIDSSTEENTSVTNSIEEKPATTSKPAITSKPTTSSKPATSSKPTTSSKPATTSKPSSTSSSTVKPQHKHKFTEGLLNEKRMLELLVHTDYDLKGEIVDWFVERDLVYLVCKGNNSSNGNALYVYDTNTAKLLNTLVLPDIPARMHTKNGKIWISFPTLNELRNYDKKSLSFEKSYAIGYPISHFDFYENSVIFTNEYEWSTSYIYRYYFDTATCEKMIFTYTRHDNVMELNGLSGFHEADVIVDEKAKALYIVESELTGSETFKLSLETMEEIFSHESGMHIKRRAILIGNYLYWSNYKWETLNAWNYRQYKYDFSTVSIGMLFANSDFVATTQGVFRNSTGKSIIEFMPKYFDSEKKYAFAATDSHNIFFSDGKKIYIFQNAY